MQNLQWQSILYATFLSASLSLAVSTLYTQKMGFFLQFDFITLIKIDYNFSEPSHARWNHHINTKNVR